MFLPTITKPTRMFHASATLIDNIYISYNCQQFMHSAFYC
ncbi:hypothetical protein LSH36_468g01000 [Paralvinella palmiformis]|uniref:Uncharacterized protein n=1 Tax=Paralvinella palmiformis TaxID=53620 RepID=A0AAD9JAD2_9ANNE|nr:hypothetical protein LSH36_468g01000 [Paralvinella palmiformis]